MKTITLYKFLGGNPRTNEDIEKVRTEIQKAFDSKEDINLDFYLVPTISTELIQSLSDSLKKEYGKLYIQNHLFFTWTNRQAREAVIKHFPNCMVSRGT